MEQMYGGHHNQRPQGYQNQQYRTQQPGGGHNDRPYQTEQRQYDGRPSQQDGYERQHRQYDGYERQPPQHNGRESQHRQYDGRESQQRQYDGRESQQRQYDGRESQQRQYDGRESQQHHYRQEMERKPRQNRTDLQDYYDSIGKQYQQEQHRPPPPRENNNEPRGEFDRYDASRSYLHGNNPSDKKPTLDYHYTRQYGEPVYMLDKDGRKAARDQLSIANKDKPASTSLEQIIDEMRKLIMLRGVHGLKSFGRMFRLFDKTDGRRDQRIEEAEFIKGCRNYGIQAVSQEKLKDLFRHFDRDGSGHISFNELLHALRPPISERRRQLILKAFHKVDKTGDGVITVKDLVDVYKVEKHPKYLSGEMTRNDILRQFLDSFDAPNDKDGKVTQEEFINYYIGVSNSIDKDVYFDLMMRQAWNLDH